MGELWQQTSEMLLRRPLLWLPVLVADLFGFLVSLGDQALVQADIHRNLQYHTALGGAVVRGQVNAASVEHATLVALLLSWGTSFLHLLLYAVALAVTAKLVSDAARQARRGSAETTLPTPNAGGVLGLVFQVWVVYVVLSFGFGWLTRSLITHGHRAWLAGGWLELGAGVILLGVLAFLLAPAALQTLVRRRTSHGLNSRAQMFAFIFSVIALVLTRYVAASVQSVRITEPAVRYVLELTGSWIAALPYAALFVGLSFLALRSVAETSVQEVSG